jgi:hypothetical protein
VQAELELSVTKTLCNNTEVKEDFEDTRYGRIKARDHFFDLKAEAERNMTVFAKFPHIIKLRFAHPDIVDHPVVEEFKCGCSEKHEQELASV